MGKEKGVAESLPETHKKFCRTGSQGQFFEGGRRRDDRLRGRGEGGRDIDASGGREPHLLYRNAVKESVESHVNGD